MNRPCRHISPAIEPLLNTGAAFSDVKPGSGDYKFVHHLTKGATPHFARELAKTSNIEYWINNDSHYDKDCGFSCSKCELAVSWLQKDSVINAI